MSGFNEKLRSLYINCLVLCATNDNEIDVNILSPFDVNSIKIFSRSYSNYRKELKLNMYNNGIMSYQTTTILYVYLNTIDHTKEIFNLISQSIKKLNYEHPKLPLIGETSFDAKRIMWHHVLHL